MKHTDGYFLRSGFSICESGIALLKRFLKLRFPTIGGYPSCSAQLAASAR